MRAFLVSILVFATACGGVTSVASDAATDAPYDAPGLDVWSSMPFVGTIQLVRDSSGSTPYYGFTAYLVAKPPNGSSFCPSGEMHGNCCVTAANAPQLARASAGTLSLHDVATGASADVAWSSSDYEAPSPSFDWSPGDAIELAAAGDVIGAFSTSAVAPAEIAGLSPNPQGNIVVSKSTDFVLSWTPAQATTMDVSVIGASTFVACRASDAAGSVTVPKELLASFTAGDSGFVVATRSGASVGHANNADVTFEIHTGASSPASFSP